MSAQPSLDWIGARGGCGPADAGRHRARLRPGVGDGARAVSNDLDPGETFTVDKTFDQVSADDYDAPSGRDTELVQLAGSDYGTVLRTQELRQARHDRGDVRIGQAVQHVTWDTGETALHGTVRGQGGSVYRTAAFFSLADGRRAEFEMGECTCPIEYNCKHVVALVLSVLELGSPGSARPESRRRPGENRWTLYWTSTDLPAAARRR